MTAEEGPGQGVGWWLLGPDYHECSQIRGTSRLHEFPRKAVPFFARPEVVAETKVQQSSYDSQLVQGYQLRHIRWTRDAVVVGKWIHEGTGGETL